MKILRKLLVAVFFVLTLYPAGSYGVIYYDDPISVGIGARPLGMGRAFVAVADDMNAMFLNPAGLGSLKSWAISTMSSNFLNEYQYTMVCGATPTPAGVFGVGYVGSRSGGIAVSGGGTTDFYNQAFVLSYGRDIGEGRSSTGDEPDLYGGATLKYYSKGFTGDVNAAGTGYNIDLGLKYVPEKWISYGLNLQNAVSGSRLYGYEPPETIPSIVKIGVSFYWLEHDARFALDQDMFLSGPDTPWPMHIGVEWRIHPSLRLRAGYDQEASGAEGGTLTTNMTFGLGFEYSGIMADLAFMQNYEQSSFASNIFSLTFSSGAGYVREAPPPKKEEVTAPTAEAVAEAAAPVKAIAQKISIIPAANLYTLDAEQTFSGTVETDVTDVWINGEKVRIRSDMTFETPVPLNIGRNEIKIRLKDTSNAEAEFARKIIRFYLPPDLAPEDARNKYFEDVVIYTEFFRYLGKDYNLNKELSRGMLAMIISKARKLETVQFQKTAFKDVSQDFWAADFISAVKSAGIMQGYGNGTFKPNAILTRAELARIMSKAAKTSEINVLGYLSRKQLNEKATMEDLVEIFSHTEMLKKEMDDYKGFLGAEGSR